MSDRLIDLEKKINMIRDSLEGAIKSLETRVRMLTETLGIAKAEPAETYNFVWAMCQVRHGLHVKCLANGAVYGRCTSDDNTCKTHIEFASKIVNSAWTLAPGWDRREKYVPVLCPGSFDWAMQQLVDGEGVRRHGWFKDKYWQLDGSVAFLLNHDIDACDWEIYYEPHNIEWAAQQLKNGKIVKRRCWKTYRLDPSRNRYLEIDDITADDWELAEEDD